MSDQAEGTPNVPSAAAMLSGSHQSLQADMVDIGQESEIEVSDLAIDDVLAAQGLGDAPTEAELTGEEEATDVKDQESSDPEKADPDPEKTPELKADDDGDDDDAEDPQPTGKGDVSKALKEARIQARAVRDENATLQTQLHEMQQSMITMQQNMLRPQKAPEADKGEVAPEFVELDEDALTELAEDDPAGLAKYLTAKTTHEINRVTQNLERQAQQAQQDVIIASEEREVSSAQAEIEGMVPGIYDDPEVYNALAKHAVDTLGLTPQDFALLDPETLIYPDGANSPTVVGKAAVAMVKMIHDSYNNATNEPALREQIRKEEYAKLVTKFKAEGGVTPPSLAQEIPDAGGAEVSWEGMSYAQAQKVLSPADLERFMQE